MKPETNSYRVFLPHATHNHSGVFRAVGILVLLALALLPGPIKAVDCYPLPTGLVAWWQGEGNASDFTGVNQGTLVNGLGFATGLGGMAFNFTGGTQGVEVPASVSLAPSNAVTVEAWVYPTLNPSGQHMVIMQHDSYKMILTPSGADFIVATSVTGSAHALGTPPPLNTWTHVAGVYDGTNVSIYVNGSKKNSQAATGLLLPASGKLLIGENPGYSSFFGMIDELSIYNTALSAAQLTAISAANSAGKCFYFGAPRIRTQPANCTNMAGGTLNFSVDAIGGTSLGYQWHFNGADLPGATTSTLTLTNVAQARIGNYSVTVSNSLGTLLSSNAFGMVTPTPCLAPPAGLVGWWKGESSLTDSAGTDTLRQQGTVGYSPGIAGSAFDFNGSGYLYAPSSDPLNFVPSSNVGISLEVWARRTGNGTSMGLVGKRSADCTSANYSLTWSAANGLSFLGVNTGPNALPLNQWVHVLASMNNGEVSIYTNGALSVSSSSGSYGTTNSAPITIGFDCGAGYFVGQLDEVSLYRADQSANTVNSLYISGSSGKCFVPGAFTRQPTGGTSSVGEIVKLLPIVAAGYTTPLTYQWQLNGTNVPGATSNTLIFYNVQLTQAGSYSLVLSNVAGQVASSAALVNVVTPVCTLPPAPIAAFWKGDGNALDLGGNNDLGAVGTIGYTAGFVGQAFNFTGNGYLMATNQQRLGFGLNPTNGVGSPFALEMWFKTPVTTGTMGLVSKYDTTCGTNAFTLYYQNGYLVWNEIYILAVIPNEWTYLVVSVANTGVASIFVNGIPAALDNLNLHPSNNGPVTIGYDCAHGYFVGQLDEVTFYSSELGFTQASALYMAGSAGKCPEPINFRSPPQSVACLPGTNVVLQAFVTGNTPISYQWKFNGTNLAGATTTTLVLTNIQADQAGAYTLAASNQLGLASSTANILIVFPGCLPAPSGLVSSWQAEANATDDTGTNNGTIQGTVGYGIGEVGKTYVFSGAGSVQVPASPSLNIPAGGQLTVEFWAQLTGNQTAMSLFGKRNSECGSYQYVFSLNPGGLVLYTPAVSIYTGVTPPQNIWFHVAFTADGNTFRVYYNGRLVGSASGGLSTPDNSPFSIGAGGPGCNQFTGLIDEMSFYNRALGDYEISAIILAGASGKCSSKPAVPPSLTNQPPSQTFVSGETLSLQVAPDGTPPFEYQWLFNSAPIGGATGSSLVITNLQAGQSGAYAVGITNAGGGIQSSNAIITVINQVSGQVVVCDQFGLQAALSQGGTVTFGCDGTVVLNQPIAITQNTVLDAGGHQVVISGANSAQPFVVSAGIHFTLLNLTIGNGVAAGANGTATGQQGQDGRGGAILNNGGVILATGCTFIGNTALGGNGGPDANGGNGQGGAIFNGAGSLALTNCHFINNRATGGIYQFATYPLILNAYCGTAAGGAIYSTGGSILLANCSFEGNAGISLDVPPAPVVGNPGQYAGPAQGGAVFSSGDTFVVLGSTFSGNQASGGNIHHFPGDGYTGAGAGGAIYQSGGVLNLSGTMFTSNSAMGGSWSYHFGKSADGSGGAVFATGSLNATNCTWLGNNSSGGIYSTQAGSGSGGAIYNAGTAVLVNSLCSSNWTRGGSSGGFQPGSTLPGCGFGGGIYNSNQLVLLASTVCSNLSYGGACAFTDGSRGGNGTNGFGGGIHTIGILRATNSTIAANQAIGGAFAPVGSEAPGGDAYGGGILQAGGNSILEFCTLANNAAIGGVGFTPGTGLGGNVLVVSNTFSLADTLLAYGSPQNIANSGGILADGGYTLSSDHSFTLPGVGSHSDLDPKLGPLASNGGATPTMSLLPGSPAIDAANPSFCLATDQRGFSRPIGTACDPGAFEAPLYLYGTISGYLPPGGIQVSDVATSSYSDPSGRYFLGTLTPGNYTVTPAAAGVLFIPASRNVNLTTGTGGLDFQSYRLNQLTPIGASGGLLQLQIAGTAGQQEVLDYSTNLVRWIPLVTNTIPSGRVLNMTTPNNSSVPVRFYRTHSQ